nr:retrotransposon protein, putative, Ty1-copia subclass [Tanacetum cinerariifolium]
MYVIEQPIPPAPVADSAANELKSMFKKQAEVERFDLIKNFHACKQEEGKPVGQYVLKMKGEQLEHLGYVLPKDLSTTGELHALLIEFEKCLPKKAATPQVMAIQEHPTKNDACHHYKDVGHWKRNCPVYLAELIKNKKQVGTTSSSGFKPPHEEEDPLHSFARTHQAPERLCLNVEVEEHSLGDLNEPANYKAAMLDLESTKWLDAMNAEMQSMNDNQVWRLVDLPSDCKTVGSKWLFKKKTDMDGNVHTYKAHLVEKRCTQLYGVDYEETFSPVAKIRAIRILIAITAFYDYEIWQMDVKTTFLNGYLDENIYMVQVEGFVDPKYFRKVCKLQKSIYGLKQASRSWNRRFDEEIKKFIFNQNLDEPCVYQKASGSNVTFLILYVDEIIIVGNHIPSLQSVKTYLGKCFAMKDLGKAAFILEIKIYQDRSKQLIRLSQSASTPREVKHTQSVPYASDIGSIMYAVRCTRPDVAFAQNITSCLQQNPGEAHWTAVKTNLNYLRNTKDMFLVYGRNPEAKLRVDCYCNAGFETDRDDTKSQIGYVFILNGGLVDWKSSKQSNTMMSTTKYEYIAASKAV